VEIDGLGLQTEAGADAEGRIVNRQLPYPADVAYGSTDQLMELIKAPRVTKLRSPQTLSRETEHISGDPALMVVPAPIRSFG
jgi:hypothetical protein